MCTLIRLQSINHLNVILTFGLFCLRSLLHIDNYKLFFSNQYEIPQSYFGVDTTSLLCFLWVRQLMPLTKLDKLTYMLWSRIIFKIISNNKLPLL